MEMYEMKDQEERGDVPVVGGKPLHGFASPAQDYLDTFISLDKELVRHPAATYYGRVVGNSMQAAGVREGDVLVIDKSLEPSEGDLVVCFVDGEFLLRFLSFHAPGGKGPRKAGKPGVSYRILRQQRLWLLPADDGLPAIEVSDANDFTVWGIVTYVIKKVR